jgi:leucyl aminopeptidase
LEITLTRPDLKTLSTDALILLDVEEQKRADLAGPLAAYYESGELSGKAMEFTLLHGVGGFAAKRVLVAGTGKAGKADAAALRRTVAGAVRLLKGKGVTEAAVVLDGAWATAENVQAAAEGALTGAWEPDQLKTDKSGPKPVEKVTIAVPAGDKSVDAAFERGKVIGEAMNVTRDIAVEPPNQLSPHAMAERARAVAAANRLRIDVLDRDRMQQLGMGALLGVAQGSAEPPVLIVMEYRPEGKAIDGHVGLVGKGVTFDTGGISIKPADGMEKMKYDMCGGAAVIGAMQAIARLKPRVAVTGIIPAVENMPGGRAQRPGDIVTSLSKKTVEILNTDAEGRLILADAITYAKQLGCTHLVDAATLTGAIVVALGPTNSGVFTNNDELLGRFMAAAKTVGDRMWHMPLDDEYREQLKTVYADIQNIGTRWGGACTAAMFLKEFVGDTPWVHVDIAGTAWLDDAKPHLAKGPTAVPLATFVQLVLDWK